MHRSSHRRRRAWSRPRHVRLGDGGRCRMGRQRGSGLGQHRRLRSEAGPSRRVVGRVWIGGRGDGRLRRRRPQTGARHVGRCPAAVRSDAVPHGTLDDGGVQAGNPVASSSSSSSPSAAAPSLTVALRAPPASWVCVEPAQEDPGSASRPEFEPSGRRRPSLSERSPGRTARAGPPPMRRPTRPTRQRGGCPRQRPTAPAGRA